MQKNQKLMIGGVIIGAIIIAVLSFLVFRPNGGSETDTADQAPVRRRISEPVNVIDVSERPYIRLVPKADGRNLTISVEEVKKPASSMEYELEYQAGSTTQGEFKNVDLSTLPAEIDAFFGSCSAGGACTYHTDILGGSLLGRFMATDDDPYAVKQDWRYFDNSGRETQVASKDAKFQLDSTNLATQRYIVVYNTPGFPGDLEESGRLLSDIYSLAGSSALTGTGELSIRTNEPTAEGETLTILGYDGTEWVPFDTTTDERTATAEVDLVEAYLVVAQ
jgi:gas vesicle protein